MVECQLPKLDVAGSNPVSRSISFQQVKWHRHFLGAKTGPLSIRYRSEGEGGDS